MPLAVTNVEFSIFLHITAVVVGFGATFSESVMFPVAMKMSARNLPYVHRLQLVLNQFFAIPRPSSSPPRGSTRWTSSTSTTATSG